MNLQSKVAIPEEVMTRRVGDETVILDLATGTLPVEVKFPNPEGLLRPGQFARIRVDVEVRKNAMLIPQRAITELQGTKTVLVVGPENKLALRTLTAEDRVGDSFVVTKGVKAGDWIVLEGLQKVRPGMVVAPKRAPVSEESGDK